LILWLGRTRYALLVCPVAEDTLYPILLNFTLHFHRDSDRRIAGFRCTSPGDRAWDGTRWRRVRPRLAPLVHRVNRLLRRLRH
ncbi:MAG: hypothetical protein AAGC55_03125, partial [Myxococcota bacterium]